MSTSTSVSSLKIHVLTKAQYDEIQNPSDTELYLVPDTIDSSPTSNSGNPVSSGGVYTALSGKADKSEMSVVDGTGANADKTTLTLKSGTSATVLKSHQDISGKANSSDLATVATSGSYNDLSNKPTIPDITGKEDKVDIVSASGTTLTAQVGKYYTLSNVGTLAITLPTIASGTTTLQTVTFYIAAGSSPAVTFTSSHSIYYSDGFEIAADSTYEVSAAYNGIAWVVASVKIVIPTS